MGKEMGKASSSVVNEFTNVAQSISKRLSTTANKTDNNFNHMNPMHPTGYRRPPGSGGGTKRKTHKNRKTHKKKH